MFLISMCAVCKGLMFAECEGRKARFWEKKQYKLIGTFHWKSSLVWLCVEEEEVETWVQQLAASSRR